ncbi:MAG: GNAT family N-acetyltransferase, partial [Actinomycetota bacterium]|nr:GNAT family N-acetyltransferase [Actinomycetota bacterium]
EDGTPVLVIGVHPDYRHRGIGTMIIDWLSTYTSEHGVPRISLCVSKDNHALNLYRQQGFLEVEDTGDSFLMVRESSSR